MKASLLAILSLTVTWPILAQPPARAEHVLDIVGYPRSPASPDSRPDAPYVGGSRSRGENEPSRSDIVVTLLSTDRSTYSIGDAIIYEVLLRNAGSRSLILPWSPDANRFAGMDLRTPGFDKMVIFLEVRDKDSRRLGAVGLQGVLGAPNVADSFETIGPGETARFRVPGRWWTPSNERMAILRQPGGQVRIKAGLLYGPDTLYSQNDIEVQIGPLGYEG